MNPLSKTPFLQLGNTDVPRKHSDSNASNQSTNSNDSKVGSIMTSTLLNMTTPNPTHVVFPSPRKPSTDSNASTNSNDSGVGSIMTTLSSITIQTDSDESTTTATRKLTDASSTIVSQIQLTPKSPRSKKADEKKLWLFGLSQICNYFEDIFGGVNSINWVEIKSNILNQHIITYNGVSKWTIEGNWKEGKGKQIKCVFRNIKPLNDSRDQLGSQTKEAITYILGLYLANHILDKEFEKLERKLEVCGVRPIIKMEQGLSERDDKFRYSSEVRKMVECYEESRKVLPITRAIQRSLASIMVFLGKYHEKYSLIDGSDSTKPDRRILKDLERMVCVMYGIEKKVYIEGEDNFITSAIDISEPPKFLNGQKLQGKDLEKYSVIDISDLISHVFFKILEDLQRSVGSEFNYKRLACTDLARLWLKAACRISVKEETLNEFARDTVVEGGEAWGMIISEAWKSFGVAPEIGQHFSQEDFDFLKECRLGIESDINVEKQIKSRTEFVDVSSLNISPLLSSHFITSISDYEELLIQSIRVNLLNRTFKHNYVEEPVEKAQKLKDIARLVEIDFRIVDYRPNSNGSFFPPKPFSYKTPYPDPISQDKFYKSHKLGQFPKLSRGMNRFTSVPSAKIGDLRFYYNEEQMDQPVDTFEDFDKLITNMAICIMQRVITVVQKRPTVWLPSAKNKEHDFDEKKQEN